MLFVVWKSHGVWQNWRDEHERIDMEIDRLNKEINIKERQKELLKLKTFSAWTLISKLQDLQTGFYAHYTNLISLINNLRLWYKEVEAKEECVSLKTTFPDTSLLSAELLDDFFENHLKNDPGLLIDFCANIAQYKIRPESISEYKDSLVQKVIDALLARREIKEFNISSHIVSNAFSGIASEISRELIANLDKQSGIFLNVNSKERGVIVPSTAIFAPSLGFYRDEMRKKLGKYSEPYFESADKYSLTFLKTSILMFCECVNFND